MGALVERLHGSDPSGATLWLDTVDYAGRLLASGRPPWLDAAEFAAWQRKTHGLLGSDVAFVPVTPVVDAWLGAQPALVEAMRGRSRTVYPLKTLLADEALRGHLTAMVRALRGSVRAPVHALTCPSPRDWVRRAYEVAHGAAIEVGDDEADTAALYVADFLRTFGETGLDALLLVESDASDPGDATATACYQSVLNVARNYRWDIGLALPGHRWDGAGAEVDFVVAPEPAVIHGAAGRVVPVDFWSGAEAPARAAGQFLFATIPADCAPELVLERLKLLR
ncbi:MAG TPA: hypothetical protein VFP48_00140 [Steroidobacteraceae bacterium]|nr:hypothetical protein [Steroidobacteraceae bacterium]